MQARRTTRWTMAAATLACLCTVLPALADPLPRDIQVVNVTPTAFTVVWVNDEPSTGTVTVFDDVLGTTPTAGAVIEPSPVLGKDPSIGTAAEDLGILRVRVSGLQPETPYFFNTITTPKARGGSITIPGGVTHTVVVQGMSFDPSDLTID